MPRNRRIRFKRQTQFTEPRRRPANRLVGEFAVWKESFEEKFASALLFKVCADRAAYQFRSPGPANQAKSAACGSSSKTKSSDQPAASAASRVRSRAAASRLAGTVSTTC